MTPSSESDIFSDEIRRLFLQARIIETNGLHELYFNFKLKTISHINAILAFWNDFSIIIKLVIFTREINSFWKDNDSRGYSLYTGISVVEEFTGYE